MRLLLHMRPGLSLTALALVLAASSCRSPSWHHQKADRTAYQAIERAQQEALGRTEPFTIEKPSTTLRRRLLLDQDLPKAGPGSLGIDELERPAHWPEAYQRPFGLRNEVAGGLRLGGACGAVLEEGIERQSLGYRADRQ